VSIDLALARVAELQSAFAPQQAQMTATAAPVATTPTQAANFASVLGGTAQAGAASPLPAAGGTSGGRAALAAAQAEVGVAEQPPGSNNSPRIAQYRQATAGSGVGPWCAYFVSWAARQAGTPLGDQGQGFGRVDDVYAWAQKTGKAIPNGAGVKPQPGDLIVWDEHIGIVESVLPDGKIQTVEGNSSDKVSRRVHDATGDGAIGYVRLG
jgi:CHAP domain-containing protein